MKTAFILFAQHDGLAVIWDETVCRDDFDGSFAGC